MIRRVPFINRVEELRVLKELSIRGLTKPLYLYGPEGCGKTRLLREFIDVFDDIGIYIDALEGESIDLALRFSNVIEPVTSIIGELVRGYSGSIGKVLAEKVTDLLGKLIVKLSLRGSRLVVIVDDVAKAIGINRIEWYVKQLYELIWKITDRYEVKNVLIIVTTSEGLSLDIVMRHTHSHIKMLWNLDEEAFKELSIKLNPPRASLAEAAWVITGGNPRALIEIALDYNWDINKWLVDLKYRLLRVVEKIKHEQLTKQLELVLEDIDLIYEEQSKKIGKLRTMLIEENLIIYKYMNTLIGQELRENSELGIGKYYAWQIPAYRKVLKQLLRGI